MRALTQGSNLGEEPKTSGDERKGEKRSPKETHTREERVFDRLAAIVEGIRALKVKDHLFVTDAIKDLAPLIRELREVIGTEVGPVLDKFSETRIDLLSDKLAITRSTNELLDGFGCRVRCPKTGRPARLCVRTMNGSPEGAFQFEVKDEETRVKQTFTSVKFPTIAVIPAEQDKRYARRNFRHHEGEEQERGR